MSLKPDVLNEVVQSKRKLNAAVNEILEKNNISLKEIVQMDHYGRTYIFGVNINENTTEEEILNIVKLTPKENYEKHIDFYGTWPCDIPYYEYYENTIEKSIKKMIETMLYFGLAMGKENIEFVIREFYNLNEKGYCDSFVEKFPIEHPIRKSYQEVSNINFEQVRLTAFVKMAMWQIEKKVSGWDFVDSEEEFTRLVEEINKMNAYAIEQFIKDNEKLLEEEPNKYNYLFRICYEMSTLKVGSDYKGEILYEHQQHYNTKK